MVELLMADPVKKAPHTFTATKGAAHRLGVLLAQPGWFSSTVQGYRGGALSEELQAEASAPDMQLVPAEGEDNAAFQRRVMAQEAIVKKWQREAFTRSLTDAERDVARACVKKHASEGKIALDGPAVAMLKALGLDQEG